MHLTSSLLTLAALFVSARAVPAAAQPTLKPCYPIDNFGGDGRTAEPVTELIKVYKGLYGSSVISFFGADYVGRLGVYPVVV
ncbi:hypothetical protein O988_06855 [Pseudogymnoascus sp. VKM F-3808]|nr:hypothetical protein O988_06855 [Pseudogymnoascus sp. VKM F-3808]